MMTNQEFLGEFLALPTEAQAEVLRLIAFLKQKYQQEESPSPSPNTDQRSSAGSRIQFGSTDDLENDPFLGMWRDREDLENSSTWVQNLRENEWSKLSDEFNHH